MNRPPPEVPRQSGVTMLAPKFRDKVNALCDALRTDGHRPLVFETLRTDERQAFLYGFGRQYDDGRGTVTNSATAALTWHGYGLAVDLVCADHLHAATDGFSAALGTHARRLELEWGGDWASFPDRPHVQWGPGMRRSPSTVAQSLRRQGKLAEVWRLVGAA